MAIDGPIGRESARAGKGYLQITEPSPWVRRFAPLVAPGESVLDLACGNGRHGRLFLARGNPTVFVDRDVDAVRDLAADTGAEVIRFDLEAGRPWPLAGRRFAAVVVVNYLYRPLFPVLLEALAENGVFIYDTFARGNERYSRPRNPDHLLKAEELLDTVRGRLHVVAYEHGIDADAPCPGVKQRICAVNAGPDPDRTDGEPRPLPLSSH